MAQAHEAATDRMSETIRLSGQWFFDADATCCSGQFGLDVETAFDQDETKKVLRLMKERDEEEMIELMNEMEKLVTRYYVLFDRARDDHRLNEWTRATAPVPDDALVREFNTEMHAVESDNTVDYANDDDMTDIE